jgi:hypothetical protein
MSDDLEQFSAVVAALAAEFDEFDVLARTAPRWGVPLTRGSVTRAQFERPFVA